MSKGPGPDSLRTRPSSRDGGQVSEERIIVLGIGNPLVGDEGVGVRVAESLMSEWSFPERVTIMDAGTMGMGMLGLLRDHDVVIVVDALDGTGEPPGTLLRLDPQELAPNQVLHSLHDVKLADVLEAAAFAGIEPHVEFLGVQIGEMNTLVVTLTPAVEAAIGEAVGAVLELLAGLGVQAERSQSDRDDVRVIRGLRTGESMRSSADRPQEG